MTKLVIQGLTMEAVKFTSELLEVISLLMAKNINLTESDKQVIVDLEVILGINSPVTVTVDDNEISLLFEVVAEDNATILKLREAAAKDGFMFSAVFNTVTLKTEVLVKLPVYSTQQKEPSMANETATEMSVKDMFNAMMSRMDGLDKASASLDAAANRATNSAEDASKAASKAVEAAAEAKAAAAELRGEILKNAEAIKVSDTRNSSILAELQQSKNQLVTANKKEESFFDSTWGQVTLWGGGAVAVGLVGYAAYTYLGGKETE